VTFPEIDTLLTSDLRVAEQLVGFASRLPDNFREQRDYVLKYQDRLKETGMDPKWPRKAGSQNDGFEAIDGFNPFGIEGLTVEVTPCCCGMD
jgi:hypothetical protein